MISSVEPLLVSISDDPQSLEVVGGKGLNLMRLTRAGFQVPPGLILTAKAYRQYVESKRLAPIISSALQTVDAASPASLEESSQLIRAAFEQGALPTEIEAILRHAFEPYEAQALAVRSSATAEDLPDLSFAGQQDTYLNVIGWDALVRAVIRCWGSLWTARAIGYRLRNHLAETDIALAVVVQRMVPSEVSGVLFTANPVSGLFSESVIDATYGLGEALVSGQVEPDHFVVDSQSLAVVSCQVGEKHVITRALVGGDVETVANAHPQAACLKIEQAAELTAVGQRIQAEYGSPQDIEWAYSGGQLFILQSRAITSLFPVPHISFDPLDLWFSFGAVQGLVGPITPLGLDTLRRIVLGAARIFGAEIDPREQSFIEPAGERLWIEGSGLLRNPVGVKMAGGGLDFVEPSIAQIFSADLS